MARILITRRKLLSLGSSLTLWSLAPAWKVATAEPLLGDTPESQTLRAQDLESDLLQQKIDNAARNAQKAPIYLPAGRFVINPRGKENSALVLPSGIRLHGAGKDRTIIMMADAAHGHVINAPFGNIEIADLTIDGNAARRQGKNGHNVRVEGDNISIRNVKLANSASYGIGIGQRRFARNVVVQNVQIENAGADGIDIKNKLTRTENVHIENVTVSGFALRIQKAQAGVDLRGKCQVKNLRVEQVPPGCDGLRFRPGEAGGGNGPGAHGSMAAHVWVSGSGGAGNGVSVGARDVSLSDLSLSDLAFGLLVWDDNLLVERAAFRDSRRAAIRARASTYGRPSRARFASCSLWAEKDVLFEDIERVVFYDTQFEGCRSGNLMKQLKTNPRIVLEQCSFDASCR